MKLGCRRCSPAVSARWYFDRGIDKRHNRQHALSEAVTHAFHHSPPCALGTLIRPGRCTDGELNSEASKNKKSCICAARYLDVSKRVSYHAVGVYLCFTRLPNQLARFEVSESVRGPASAKKAAGSDNPNRQEPKL